MGEAKRREELGLPPRQKKVELNKSDRYISWLPITKSRIKKYPYMCGNNGNRSDNFLSQWRSK